MVKSTHTFIMALVVGSIMMASCAKDAASGSSVQQFRAEKDAAFRDPRTTPLSQQELKDFSGLHYFAEDSAYVVEAQFVAITVPDTVIIGTTHAEDKRTALRAGRLLFTINNQACTLTAYRFAGQDIPGFFVPFKDATSGMETYGAGRYLDLQEQPTNSTRYVLNFNNAYNPYCAYNDAYSCPLVPDENTLPVAILAGEKTWQ